MAGPDPRLIDFFARQRPEAASPATRALLEELQKKYGSNLLALLFYGSCLRRGDHFDGLLDLYLLVDDYRQIYPGRRLPALGNRLLPPNVFYLETEADGRKVRCKYAILSATDFARGCRSWFHPYIWARFVQPTALLYCASEQVGNFLDQAQAMAAVSFVNAVLPCLPEGFSTSELWGIGFNLSYSSELRPERPGQGERLYQDNHSYYDELSRLILSTSKFARWLVKDDGNNRFRLHLPAGCRHRARRAWRLRALQGKLLSILRLTKAAFTFQGGYDYLCWKIERHSGLELPTPSKGRHTLFSFSRAAWQAWRRRGFR
jgi:hypothetical protein